MNQQRLLFEYSPAFVLLCIALGIGYAYLLYRSKHTWSNQVNKTLFAIRALLVALLAFLLIGPILKLTSNEYEKPSLVFLIDNSVSVGEVVDSLRWPLISENVEKTADALETQGFEVHIQTLDNESIDNFKFDQLTSDLNGTVHDIMGEYESKNLAGVVVLSDGIYNSGSSPLYTPSKAPIYTVGLGDTTQRIDLSLRNLLYNKIAYQGNQFPLRAEVLIQGTTAQEVQVSVYKKGKLVSRERKNSENKSILEFDFQIEASEKGIQRIDVAVEPIGQEKNKKNNYASAFIEVVEGKKKILLVSPSPHPDDKAIRAVVEKNANYELILHIPGVKEASPEALSPSNIDLAIFQQVLDYSGKTLALYNRLKDSGTSMFLMLGNRSNLRQLAANGIPLTFENPGQWDEVTPVINPQFKFFGFSDNLNSIFAGYPPVNVPFGKFTFPPNVNVVLFQRIGRVNTERPLLYTSEEDNRKTAILLGDGIWRWRLDEFAETQKTDGFDELFSKLIQYLSTREDRRKFRSFPLQNEFTASEHVVFESQVYNELYQQVYGNKIDIELINEKNEKTQYSYVTSPGNSRYQIGGLQQGVYQYKSATDIEGSRQTVSGEFLVTAQNIEAQNLTADFNLLRKWAKNTGGSFHTAENIEGLATEFQQINASSLIHTEDSFNPLINLKLVFFILLLLISTEWFLRKWLGSY